MRTALALLLGLSLFAPAPAHAQRDVGQLLDLGLQEVMHNVSKGTCDGLFSAMKLSRVLEWIAETDTDLDPRASTLSQFRRTIEADYFSRNECIYPSDYDTLPVSALGPGGGGTIQSRMLSRTPPFMLALQYMTEAERKAFMEHLSEPHRAMVREWEAENKEEVQQLRADLDLALHADRLSQALQFQANPNVQVTPQLDPQTIQRLRDTQFLPVLPNPDGN